MTKKIACALSLALLTACADLLDWQRHSPGGRYMPGDRILAEGENLLAPESELSLFCEQNMCDFSSVRDIAVSDSDKAFILNDYGEILILDQAGAPRRFFESFGQGPAEMTSPSIIRVRNEMLYVLDRGNNKIVLFDLKGDWIADIVIRDILAMSFEVDEEGKIYIPRLVPHFLGNEDLPLMHVYGQDGTLEKSLAQNWIVQKDLLNIPANPLICLTGEGNIVLGLNIQGTFYLVSKSGELMQRFAIRRGAEWRESRAFQRMLDRQFGHGNSWRNCVDNVAVDSSGRLYATFGGTFKREKTLAMIFNERGEFVGRLFGNERLPFAPTCFQLVRDSTVWIYSREKEFLGVCKIDKRKAG